MKKFTLLIYSALLVFTLSGTASALPYYEAYTGYQAVWEGEAYNFGFDFWFENSDSGIRDNAPGLSLTSDALGLTDPADYLAATLFIDFSSMDLAKETAKINLAAWNGNGDISQRFDLGIFHFDINDDSLVTFTHIFSDAELAAFAQWGWGKVRIGARDMLGDNDFAIERVAMEINNGNDAAPVPEPATMLLLGTGLIGLAGLGRLKIKNNT